MASLDTLPFELLLEVMSYHESGYSTLRNLSLVCHTLHAVATGLLYRVIELEKDTLGHANHQRRLACLLRTLLEQPDLRGNIHTLHLSVVKWGRDESVSNNVLVLHHSDSFTGVLYSCLHAMKEFGCERDLDWTDKAASAWEPALGGLLISLLPKLKVLNITVWDSVYLFKTARWPFMDLFGTHQPSQIILSRFRNLIDLHTHGNNLRLLSAKMEGLERLSIGMTDLVNDTENGPRHVPTLDTRLRFPKLNSLTLYCETTEFIKQESSHFPDIFQLIRYPKLKAIDIRCTKTDSHYTFNPAASPPAEFQTMVDKLLVFKPTLEHLSLCHVPYSHYGTLQKLAALESLTEFKVLKRIEIPWEAMTASKQSSLAEMFPGSLEQLSIVGVEKKTLAWLKRLAGIKNSSLPKLRLVELECVPYFPESNGTTWFRKHGRDVFGILKSRGVNVHLCGIDTCMGCYRGAGNGENAEEGIDEDDAAADNNQHFDSCACDDDDDDDNEDMSALVVGDVEGHGENAHGSNSFMHDIEENEDGTDSLIDYDSVYGL